MAPLRTLMVREMDLHGQYQILSGMVSRLGRIVVVYVSRLLLTVM